MQLRYVFSELGQGLRRNLSMHLAVVLTLFVSLTLVGLGVLFNQQADKAADHWGNQLQITVYLCRVNDSNAVCPNAVTDAQKTEIAAVVDDNPEVAGLPLRVQRGGARQGHASSTATSCSPARTPRSPPRTCRRRCGSRCRTRSEYEGITSAVQGLDGVSKVRDMREQVGPDPRSRSTCSSGSRSARRRSWCFAALLLVANTIRLAAFARRKEIGIMRLVGASTLYIALPFLLEALVTALIGVVLAGGALWRLHVLRHRRALRRTG